jgi:large subunit ribosomal protein L23
MTKERLLKVLLAPHMTEKTARIEPDRQYVFRVVSYANKTEVKKAVEMLFDVTVEAVQISNVKAKKRRHGRIMGERNGWKKAFVKLKEGQSLEFAESSQA